MQQEGQQWSVRSGVLGLALLCASFGALAVNKCTDQVGRIVYQDAPCDVAAKQSQQVRTWNAPDSDVQGLAAAPLQFSGDPQLDLVKAEAALDNISSIGLDCKIKLKVGSRRLRACQQFLVMLAPNGQFVAITDVVQKILANKPAAAAGVGELNRINGHMREIVRSKQFVTANLGQ